MTLTMTRFWHSRR